MVFAPSSSFKFYFHLNKIQGKIVEIKSNTENVITALGVVSFKYFIEFVFISEPFGVGN